MFLQKKDKADKFCAECAIHKLTSTSSASLRACARADMARCADALALADKTMADEIGGPVSGVSNFVIQTIEREIRRIEQRSERKLWAAGRSARGAGRQGSRGGHAGQRVGPAP
jgi:hypothetical protein